MSTHSRNPQQNLRAIVRAVRVLNRRIWGVDQELVAKYLAKHLDSNHVGGVGQFLLDCAEYMEQAERRAERPCQHCGKRIRGDAPRTRYCGPKCKQAAYRQRVTATTRPTCAPAVTVTPAVNASDGVGRNTSRDLAP